MSASITIRQARASDAAALLALKLALDAETRFMMFEPGERSTDPAEAAADLHDALAAENSTILVADAGSELAGYVEARGGEFRRNGHTATLVAGVRQAYAGRGVGSRLFTALLDWAGQAGLTRLELTVMTGNDAAIALYRKFGFEIEGVRRASMLVDGGYVDEYYMARIHEQGFAEREPSG